jgi:hypothetical protein
MIPTLKAQYPLFKAVVWFDINKENDWRHQLVDGRVDRFLEDGQGPVPQPLTWLRGLSTR